MSAVTAAPVAPAGAGTIGGRVLNGTHRQRPVAGQEVLLLRMGAGGPISTVAKTDAGGRFQFDGLAADAKIAYVLATRYQRADYVSDPLRFSASRTPLTADLVVFESTTERPALLHRYRIVIIEKVTPGVIDVRELVDVANPTERTYLGEPTGVDRRVTVRLPLPPGASEVRILRGAAPTQFSGGLWDTLPVTPGVRQIAMSYRVRYWGASAALRWSIDVPTGSLDVFLPEEKARATGIGLQEKPPGTLRGQRFVRLGAENLARGRDVAVRLSGLPANYRPLTRAVAAGLGLVLFGGLLWAIVRNRAAGRPGEGADPEVSRVGPSGSPPR
ncbi:MAG: hypothetical protein HY660_18665 [Armatimonadetes bacterium]|nr:hypothetical protein [Armatimonadota bacterium]